MNVDIDGLHLDERAQDVARAIEGFRKQLGISMRLR